MLFLKNKNCPVQSVCSHTSHVRNSAYTVINEYNNSYSNLFKFIDCPIEQHLLQQHSEINGDLNISFSIPVSSPMSAMKSYLFTVELIRTKRDSPSLCPETSRASPSSTACVGFTEYATTPWIFNIH